MEGIVSPLHSFTPLPGGDTAREQFSRGVLRPPPRHFSIQFLPPSYKGSHNHGMRITPATYEGDSVFTMSHNWEYEAWRKWEDILWFQDALETAYARAAREKKARLAQGKGVKTINGIYKHDMASSWESLPPGPLPSSVAQDIHQHLPRLSKRGTVFRASQATVDQRQKEFRFLVEALFSDSMPSLIQELRSTHHVRDFFGLWRRDYEAMESAPSFVRNSVTSSVFSSYFSESSPTLAASNNSKRASSTSPRSSTSRHSSSSHRSSSSRPRSAGSTDSSVRSSRMSVNSSSASTKSSTSTIKRLSGSSEEGIVMAEIPRLRTHSNTSSDTSSIHSDGCSEIGSMEATPTIVGDSPITFDHNPQIPQAVERCSVLEVLPEEREMLAKSPETYFESSPKQKSINSSIDRKTNRTWQVVSTPVTKTSFDEGRRTVRASCQSRSSIDSSAEAFLDGIGLSLPSIEEHDFRSSISTLMTTHSADAVLPRESSSAGDSRSLPERASNTISLSEFEIYPPSIGEENSTQSVLPFPSLPSPFDRPQSPAQRSLLSLDIPTTPTRPTHGSHNEGSSFECLPSPTSAVSPTSGDLLTVKAAHNTSIIVLRVSKDTAFEDIRERLYNKFVGQEGVPLSKEFSVAMIVPSNASPSPVKSSSSKLSRPLSVSSVDKMELHFIDSQYDWEQIVLIRESNKVTLRILDAPRV